ncbi:unnamed protein product [Lactuca saligna]|uniref:Protein kinase domain-containing protein n=1 Tax=Lactuca saligna TaxID=75948 RepID=A0AA35W114_LACSI|nr:unnamed protein product [Lactuca saligna]
MNLLHIYLLIIFISLTMVATALVPSYVKPGCTEMCGNVRIPYPFGIEPNCFLNKWYAVDCNSSTPYLSALKNLPLLVVDLDNQTVLVNVTMTSGCQNPVSNSSQLLNIDLGDTPFLFSKSHNKFIVEGCGAAVILSNGNALTGCTPTCFQKPVSYRRRDCFGINCCQTNVPYYMKTFSVNITTSSRQMTGYKSRSCVSAFFEAADSYVRQFFPGQSGVGSNSFVPLVLRWTLTENDISQRSCGVIKTHKLETSNDTLVSTLTCSCQSEIEEGNPYLGCQVSEECTKCMDTWGYCRYNESNAGVRNFYCDHRFHNGGNKSSSSRAIFLGVGISIGVLILTVTSFATYKIIQRTNDKRRRKRFFERNGGLLLKQQEAGKEGLADKTNLFTSYELEKATDHFNENRILGRGGQGTVYKGMLTDGRLVAVKKSKAVDESQLEQFINEVVILSQVNHRNVVKLLGCCLETEVPLLVSEFVPNGTLYKHIHDETGEVFVPLNMRLRIATEVAGALSYLHSATSIPIYHRDIKSTNILLDEKYRAKISDFGTSRFISISRTHLTTLVQGTIGYLDPEYFQSSQFTEKSDVYSFGVVLVELLTGEKPISLTRFGETRSLVTHFMMAFEEDRVMSILDAKIVREDAMDELMEVVNLAFRCLNLYGKNRPTMKEVASVLEAIRTSNMSSMVLPDFGKVKCDDGEEEFLILSYHESTSTSFM